MVQQETTTSEKLLARVRPTKKSQSSRIEILKCFIKILKKEYPDLKVFVFGSFPLKTYLPKSDIDVTVAVSSDPQTFIENLADFLRSCNKKSGGSSIRIEVTKVLADASVPLIKCMLNRYLPFDISVNALGGVASLAFLEEVDDKIGRDHFFKRSIILIKAWLLHENKTKILDSSNRLLSTYGLEVMILYIINRFGPELQTPLQCLSKFLDYYSSFDWEKHTLTIRGPIWKGTKLLRVVDPNENLLLDKEFLAECCKKYTFEASGGCFDEKPISIVDPVNPRNNIGKSVSKQSEFINGLKVGKIKLHAILESGSESDIGKQFPFLTSKLFKASDPKELEDLKCDLKDMNISVKEAKELYLN